VANVVTIGLLQAIINQALAEPGVTSLTRIVVPSDEEGNQMHFCHSWGIEHELVEDPNKKHEWINKPGGNPVLVLWPSDDTWEQ
jgi:hypothetical protein